ncbi:MULTISPECIES: restriction endonuclease subunit S [unclassified Synechococcus]|uniref:restriction endonuclease subunit S n=1 Tax=unclassified Synechococcus TaxID=2626047 RepID=UPI0021A36B6B|nr:MULTISPECIES: restriction endonuclease subunit S [unclassified Synechococcus]MCT0212544.1 restriction endonuclease subunit S [Synechococcus sp. CS-1326]MCT0232060.1 restriction endonuclease subunit S [Synechococcus sp. CS-1327]
MELKPGYKQTEVGVIPEEWEVVTATEACELVVDCKNRTPPVVPDSDYAVVRTPNVRNGQFVIEDLRFTDEASFREWTARAVPQFGDILITREAPLGEVCAVPEARNVCLGQRMMLYRPSPTKTETGYLLYSLMSVPVRVNLLRKIGGSTVGHAKVDDIRYLQLPLPPLPEQRAIATALSDVDALLGALDRLIAKKRDLKQAAMQQLLTGQTRLPGFHGEWEVKRLGEMGWTYGGLTGKGKADFGEGSACYITFLNVMSNVVIKCEEFEHVHVSSSETQNQVIKGDLLFNGSSETPEEIAMCSVLLHDVSDLYLNSFCFGFRFHCNAQADGLFFAYYFRSRVGREFVKSLAQGSTRYNVSKSALLSSTLHLPSLPEQTAIAAVLTDMDAELVALEQRQAKTRAIKQGMMQELLSGRTRLVEAETPGGVSLEPTPRA